MAKSYYKESRKLVDIANRPNLPDFLDDQFTGVSFDFTRTDKRRHYWLWSRESGAGKTYLLKSLFETYRAIQFVPKQRYFEGVTESI